MKFFVSMNEDVRKICKGIDSGQPEPVTCTVFTDESLEERHMAKVTFTPVLDDNGRLERKLDRLAVMLDDDSRAQLSPDMREGRKIYELHPADATWLMENMQPIGLTASALV